MAGPDHDTVADVLARCGPSPTGSTRTAAVVDDDRPGMAEDGSVPVCRFDEVGDLVQSELLTGDDAADAIEEALAAPCHGRPDLPERADRVRGDRGRRRAGRGAVRGHSVCVDRGVFIDGLRHELTEEVLYWALSPGWTGSVDGGVPLPDELRD